MPEPDEGLTVADEDRIEHWRVQLAHLTGEQEGVEKIQAAVLAIGVRHATRALVDQEAADRQLPIEIERLAADLGARITKLRAAQAKLRSEHQADMAPPEAAVSGAQKERVQS